MGIIYKIDNSSTCNNEPYSPQINTITYDSYYQHNFKIVMCRFVYIVVTKLKDSTVDSGC